MELSITQDFGGTGLFKNDELCDYEVFNVLADDYRILTIVSDDDSTIKKWSTELLKASKQRSIPLIAGISVDRENYDSCWGVSQKVYKEANPYSTLTICVGAQCLIYNLPEKRSFPSSRYYRYSTDDEASKAVCAFLSDPKLICVGIGMDEIAAKLDAAYGLKVANHKDIRSLAEKAMGPADQMWKGYMSKFGLNRMVSIVLGPDWEVTDRPTKKIEWWLQIYTGRFWREEMSPEKVKFLTVDAYLCYEMGFWFLGRKDDDGASSSKNGKKKDVEKRLKKKVVENLKKWSL